MKTVSSAFCAICAAVCLAAPASAAARTEVPGGTCLFVR